MRGWLLQAGVSTPATPEAPPSAPAALAATLVARSPLLRAGVGSPPAVSDMSRALESNVLTLSPALSFLAIGCAELLVCLTLGGEITLTFFARKL